MTRDQADRCHAGGWDDCEIAAFTARFDRLRCWGYSVTEAEALAERLTLRDREADLRRMCIECGHCSTSLLCSESKRAGIGRDLGRVVATLLQHCPAFAPTDADQTGVPRS